MEPVNRVHHLIVDIRQQKRRKTLAEASFLFAYPELTLTTNSVALILGTWQSACWD